MDDIKAGAFARCATAGLIVMLAACGQASEEPATEAAADVQADTVAPTREADSEAEKAVDASDAQAATSGPMTACADGETKIFQCTVKGGKMVAVCATGPEGGKFVQYRYGDKQKAAELMLPAKSGKKPPVYARTGYSGGGEAQLIFANGNYRYVVYSRIVRTRFDGEGNEPDFQSGVMVKNGDKQQADLRCTDPADADIERSAAEQLINEDDSAFIY